MERILIIEDETPMRTALADLLAAEGYRVLTAADGERGLQRALDEKPGLILLDIMLPKLDGFALCAELRRLSNAVPVLMLTAKGQIEDRVTGLDAGADDYLVKPFSTEELLARVRALLRRVERKTKSPVKLKLGDVEIDLARQTAVRGKKPVHLTAKEFAMLRLLAEAEGEPVSPRKISRRGLGLHRVSDDAHGGQPHRQPARQAGEKSRRSALAQNRAWRGIQTGIVCSRREEALMQFTIQDLRFTNSV